MKAFIVVLACASGAASIAAAFGLEWAGVGAILGAIIGAAAVHEGSP